MEESDLIRIIGGAFMAFVVVVGSCSVANTHKRASAAVEMQKNGADMLDVPCALDTGTERYCELRAASKAAAQR